MIILKGFRCKDTASVQTGEAASRNNLLIALSLKFNHKQEGFAAGMIIQAAMAGDLNQAGRMKNENQVRIGGS